MRANGCSSGFLSAVAIRRFGRDLGKSSNFWRLVSRRANRKVTSPGTRNDTSIKYLASFISKSCIYSYRFRDLRKLAYRLGGLNEWSSQMAHFPDSAMQQPAPQWIALDRVCQREKSRRKLWRMHELMSFLMTLSKLYANAAKLWTSTSAELKSRIMEFQLCSTLISTFLFENSTFADSAVFRRGAGKRSESGNPHSSLHETCHCLESIGEEILIFKQLIKNCRRTRRLNSSSAPIAVFSAMICTRRCMNFRRI